VFNGALLKKVLALLKGIGGELAEQPHFLGQQKAPVDGVSFDPFGFIPFAQQQI
jgi:hypothetical protein